MILCIICHKSELSYSVANTTFLLKVKDSIVHPVVLKLREKIWVQYLTKFITALHPRIVAYFDEEKGFDQSIVIDKKKNHNYIFFWIRCPWNNTRHSPLLFKQIPAAKK